jgi:hypothetical protein
MMDERMQQLTTTLHALVAEAVPFDAAVARNLEELGYGLSEQ